MPVSMTQALTLLQRYAILRDLDFENAYMAWPALTLLQRYAILRDLDFENAYMAWPACFYFLFTFIATKHCKAIQEAIKV